MQRRQEAVRTYGIRNLLAKKLFDDDLVDEEALDSLEKKKRLFDEDINSIQQKKDRLDKTTDHTRKEYLREIIENNPRPSENKLGTSGVLLRDEILYYQRSCNLIEPFEIENLKPAAYKLRVGDQYSVEGESNHLRSGQKLTIGPFQVAIIKTRERVNLPHFLIGRWNIQVSKAYKGLLWVGGPQVDPGYSGYLFCPIYNLSSSPVELKQGESLAVIDFVKTTPHDKQNDTSFEEAWNNLDGDWEYADREGWSEPPKPDKYKEDMTAKDEITFEDYDPEKLKSALFAEVEDNLNEMEKQINQLENALRLSIAAIVTIISILFTVLSIIVTRGSSGGEGGSGAISNTLLQTAALVGGIGGVVLLSILGIALAVALTWKILDWL